MKTKHQSEESAKKHEETSMRERENERKKNECRK